MQDKRWMMAWVFGLGMLAATGSYGYVIGYDMEQVIQGSSVSLANGGGLLIKSGPDLYQVESTFSFPNMSAGNWNRLTINQNAGGEWSVSMIRSRTGFLVIAQGSYYKLVRNISIGIDHTVIQDTFTNLTGSPLGIVFNNTVTAVSTPVAINMGGKYATTHYPYDAANPPWNPTIYFAGQNAGLGMVAVDDYYRLQLNLFHDATSGTFGNQSFGLPAGDSYTFTWALYPTTTSDYYDFINLTRRDYVPNCTIEGSCACLSYDIALSWTTQQLTDWLNHRGVKIVILFGSYSGGPWLGEDSNYIYHIPNFSLDQYLNTLKQARLRLRQIDPTIKVLVPFETALSPDSAAGNLTPAHPDSVSILANGSPGIYGNVNPATDPHQYIYYPTLTNSYYQWVKARLLRGLADAQMDGIYFDLFSYANGYAEDGFRWTYDRWDNRTVDMNLSTYTIARTKADLCKLTEDARTDFVNTALNYKTGNVVVVNDMGVTAKIRNLPVFHFSETIADYGYTKNHFSTPISLGWTPGYYAGAVAIGKAGTWWQTWATDSDYFQDIKDKLASANLYYTYVAPPGSFYSSSLTRPTIVSRMFPITIQELHNGWIKGAERILTLYPGTYTWNDNSTAMAYFYDANGQACSGSITTTTQNGKNSFTISFPTGGAAALIKQ